MNRLSLLPLLSLNTVELVGRRWLRPQQGQLASLTQKGLENPIELDGFVLQFTHLGGTAESTDRRHNTDSLPSK